MHDSEIVFNIFYCLICFCIVYPPEEFVGLGLTINQLFASFLGSEVILFIQYHVKRTCLTFFIISNLPVVYMIIFYSQFYDAKSPTSPIWSVLLFASVLLPLISSGTIFYWSRKSWANHPISKMLLKYSNANTNFSRIAADINAEYRRNDRISIKMNPISKVIATENWIIKTGMLTVYFAHQSDTALIVDKSDSHDINIESPTENIQYLNIQVKPTRENVQAFSIRIKALDFKTLQDRINRPITILSSVKFYQSVLERFIEVFQDAVAMNPKFLYNQEITENCFACMQQRPNIKIQKNCLDILDNGQIVADSSRCHDCYCRPMWCIDCLAKWFASRQDNNEQETWLQQKCTCPMCRAKFCILDVCFITEEI